MSLMDKLASERRARLAAERMLALKSRELFDANRKLAVQAKALSVKVAEQEVEQVVPSEVVLQCRNASSHAHLLSYHKSCSELALLVPRLMDQVQIRLPPTIC